jgi:hypothetical protein
VSIGQRIARVCAIAAASAGVTLAAPTVAAAIDAAIAHASPVAGYPLAAYVPPCVEEDGSGGPVPCLWDGTTRGNRTGRTFVVLRSDLPD